ncbi:MAG: M20/M25/M40 family metallo-hydrolase [Planctomycetales bacterium]
MKKYVPASPRLVIRRQFKQVPVIFWLACCMLAILVDRATAEESVRDIDQRISATVRYLASDELEGRGLETEGIKKAASFIAKQFEEMGLDTTVIEGQPYQECSVSSGARLGDQEQNTLALLPPDGGARVLLKLEEDFTPLAAGGSAELKVPLVFVGYGITDDEAGYDDYAGVDVEEKCVIMLRHQPQRGNVHSQFGKDPSRHAYFQTKISNAFAHGAAAVVFVTGQFEIDKQVDASRQQWQVAVDEIASTTTAYQRIRKPSPQQAQQYQEKINRLVEQVRLHNQASESESDSLIEFHQAGSGGPDRTMPIVHCRRAVVDQVLKEALGSDLSQLEKKIDDDGKPHSAPLPGWQVECQTAIERRRTKVSNVIGVLEGEGPLADQTVIIGAHYDHIGYGGPASAAPDSKEIHNGADDNGSGVAALLEVARKIAGLDRKLPRRLVFIAFTGEERGLLGSAHYVNHPLFSLEDTVAMLNMDMVGRLKGNKLIINGTGTAEEFDLLVQRLNAQHDFKVVRKPSGYGPSDHASFYEKTIPVLHFFSGAHADYHRPSDDFEKLNIEGIRRISGLVADIATTITETDARPKYKKTKRPRIAGGRWPYFGSRPDYGYEKPGVRMAGVSTDSPADRAGIQADDVIVQFGDARIGTVVDFANALSGHKAADKIDVVVVRDGQKITLPVILGPPRR